MTISRTSTVVQASASLAVSPATSVSAWMPVSGNSTALLVKITNGATGPTTPASVSVDLSPDGGVTEFPDAGGPPFVGGTANNGVYSAAFELLEPTMHYRTRFVGGNQPVTVAATEMRASGTP